MSEIKLNFSPTELQKKHIESVEWLLGENRAEGRTSLMAFVFLKKAIENIGTPIKLFDHYAGMHAKDLIKSEINRMVPEELAAHVHFGYDTVTIK